MIKNLLICLLFLVSCYQEQKTAVHADFEISLQSDYKTVPIQVSITNKSTGGDNYLWTFEGAEPATSDKEKPGSVLYRNAGTYKIRLEVWNIDERKSKEISIELDSAVRIGFSPEVIVNNLAPAQYNFHNTTQGGSRFKWVFEGGEPSSSDTKTPPTIIYALPGTYKVSLEVFNGSETFTSSQTIKVDEATTADFEITPFFDNQDMETPLRASLNNLSTNALTYKWKCSNAVFANDTARNTEVLFTLAGQYTIVLEAWNGKQIITAQKDIEVKPNTNLYTIKDVKLGIRSAHNNIGCFFSGALRKTIKRSEVNEETGAKIDLAFFSLNENFEHCSLLSPHLVEDYGFYPIPKACTTSIVSKLPESFDLTIFNTMSNDVPFKQIDIKALTDANEFDSSLVPRLLLFETADGRKGALKIKAFIKDAQNSHVLCDIKITKRKVQK